VRDDILEGRWEPPLTDGSGRDRTMAQRAPALLGEADYTIKDGVLVERTSSRPFAFEILVQSRTQERLSMIYADSLRRIGICANVRLADEVQYERRRQKFDFDMLIAAWVASPSPGYEQRSSGVRRAPIKRRLTTSLARAHRPNRRGFFRSFAARHGESHGEAFARGNVACAAVRAEQLADGRRKKAI
jgi:hypothetical protein